MNDVIGRALERVLGDRQWHEAQITAQPASNADAYRNPGLAPSLRIYVATKEGQHQLNDDRDRLSPEQRARLELVEAEFVATQAEAMAGLPGTLNPRIACKSECKGEMLHLLAQNNQHRPRMDYVAFLDDDIEVSVSDLLAATEAAAQRECVIFQLQLSQDSHAVWPLLKERALAGDPEDGGFPERWSELDFVEIMAPVIAQVELDRGLLNVLAPFKSGFGWDFYLLPVLKELYSDFRPGLYRGAWMRHGRPVQTANDTRFSHGLTAVEEEELMRAGLLMCLLDGSAPFVRQAFLQRLGDCWRQQSERLRCVASALGSISERHWQARALEGTCRQLTNGLEQREQALTASQAEIQRLQAEVQRLIDVHRDEQIAMRTHVAHVDGRNSVLQEMVQSHNDAIQRYEAELKGYARYVDEIKHSPTWRTGRLLLSPLRWLKGWWSKPPQPDGDG